VGKWQLAKKKNVTRYFIPRKCSNYSDKEGGGMDRSKRPGGEETGGGESLMGGASQGCIYKTKRAFAIMHASRGGCGENLGVELAEHTS